MPDTRKSPVVALVIAAVAALALAATLIGSWASDGSDDAIDGGAATESSQDGSAAQDRAPDATWEQLVRRQAGDPMALGDVDAPVVMVAYSEFQCPFCGKFARDTEPALIDEYVESGVLRIEWRDFPYLGPESGTAAEGGRAAAEQGKFWEFHDAMYADQLPPNSGDLDEDYLVDLADGIGLDADRFRADLTSQATKDAVARDFQEGQAIGVTGTPAFIINGVPIIGAQPIEVFETTIEQAAEDASS